MKIGRCHDDVAQARRLKHIKILIVFCNVCASLVRRTHAGFFPIIFIDAKFLKAGAANACAIVAICAAKIDKFNQTIFFIRRQVAEASC